VHGKPLDEGIGVVSLLQFTCSETPQTGSNIRGASVEMIVGASESRYLVVSIHRNSRDWADATPQQLDLTAYVGQLFEARANGQCPEKSESRDSQQQQPGDW